MRSHGLHATHGFDPGNFSSDSELVMLDLDTEDMAICHLLCRIIFFVVSGCRRHSSSLQRRWDGPIEMVPLRCLRNHEGFLKILGEETSHTQTQSVQIRWHLGEPNVSLSQWTHNCTFLYLFNLLSTYKKTPFVLSECCCSLISAETTWTERRERRRHPVDRGKIKKRKKESKEKEQEGEKQKGPWLKVIRKIYLGPGKG